MYGVLFNDGTMKRSVRIAFINKDEKSVCVTTKSRMLAARWENREDAQKFVEYAKSVCSDGCVFKVVKA